MGQEPITGYNGLLGGYRTRGVGIGYPLLKRNGQLIIIMTKRNNIYFDLRSLHLQFIFVRNLGDRLFSAN